MENKTEHSPLPWSVVTRDGSMGSIESVDGYAVAQCQMRLGDQLHEERKANAEFIVRAANSHEALVKALRTTKAELECTMMTDARERAIKQADAALSLAKEEVE